MGGFETASNNIGSVPPRPTSIVGIHGDCI